MPQQEVIERAKRDKEEGKSPSTQAGEFVREGMHHIREGKHGAANTNQVMAIGISKGAPRRRAVMTAQWTQHAGRAPANRRNAKGGSTKSRPLPGFNGFAAVG
jgi:hypothetical protein